jgi:hypothetical protein
MLFRTIANDPHTEKRMCGNSCEARFQDQNESEDSILSVISDMSDFTNKRSFA